MYERYSLSKDFEDVVSLRGLALTATFTTLVFLATSLFYLALTSNGFFNLGEAFIYVAAMIGGPFVGAVAGGVGAALADIVLGYAIFAPATFVLKAAEGFVAGLLFHLSSRVRKEFRIVFVSIMNVVMLTLSALLFDNTIGGGFTLFGIEGKEVYFEFPGYVILIITILLCTLLWVTTIFLGEKGQMTLSCVSAGIIIVVGYFFYEWMLFGLGAATVEIPFNIGQVLFGTAIAIPVVSYLYQLGIIESPKEKKKIQNSK
ncbi:MAG: ECF transporter S component [Candidatus Heimdallarchaeaceae archaeon]